jgi:ribonuclease D
MLPSINDPVLIDTPEKLKDLVTILEKEKRLAVDTEANSLHAYYERVCLIQFSTPFEDYLVDPIVMDDLTYLGPIFSNPAIETVFHAVEYDLIGLQRDFAFTFANIFDTMVAARTLGYKQVGLASLLLDKFGIEIDKHNQKADWGVRPLSPSMVSYAGIDTHYLLELRDILQAELEEKGLWQLAQEDFKRACFVTNINNHPQKASWEKIDGRKDLDEQQLSVLNELCLCRNKIASKMNRPVFKVLDDKVLMKLVLAEINNYAEFEAAGMTEKQLNRFGQTMYDALMRGRHAPPVKPTETERLPESQVKRLQKLKLWRKERAKLLEVESDVVLPKVYMQTIAQTRGLTPEKLAKLMADTPWRYQQYGPDILAALS